MPTASGLRKFCSQLFAHFALARASSSAVMGSRASDSLTASSAARAFATSWPGASCAPVMSTEGSCSAQANANVPEASCFSVSRLCSRPEGVSPRISASSSTAANSGAGPAGT